MIGQKEFAAAALDSGKKAFVVHVAYLDAKMSLRGSNSFANYQKKIYSS